MIAKDLTSGIPAKDAALRLVVEQLKEILKVLNGNVDQQNIAQMRNLGKLVLHSLYFALQNTPMESLRTVRGTVGGATTPPTIREGTGWTVIRTLLGRWKITFSTAFASPPSVQVTAIQPNLRIAQLESLPLAGSFAVLMENDGGGSVDGDFCFRAEGPP